MWKWKRQQQDWSLRDGTLVVWDRLSHASLYGGAKRFSYMKWRRNEAGAQDVNQWNETNLKRNKPNWNTNIPNVGPFFGGAGEGVVRLWFIKFSFGVYGISQIDTLKNSALRTLLLNSVSHRRGWVYALFKYQSLRFVLFVLFHFNLVQFLFISFDSIRPFLHLFHRLFIAFCHKRKYLH